MKIVAIFPYIQTFNPHIGHHFEPLIEVTLSHGDQWSQQTMFLDSGADISLIPASLGNALGLVRRHSSTRVRGLIAERSNLQIVQIHLHMNDKILVPIRVGWSEDNNVPPLLGRLDVFDRFTFEFNHERRMVIVRQ